MRFNEAGAIKPRKVRSLIREGDVVWDGFNEAGAIKPRKELAAHIVDAKSRASMRPGRLNPGKFWLDLEH